MKPIAIQIYWVQIVLIVLATSFAFLSLGVADYNLEFWNATWGVISHGEAQLPIVLGVIPFSNLTLFLSFLFLYLLFEFYGFKTALYTVWALSVVMLIQFYLFYTLQNLNPTGLNHNPLLTGVALGYLNPTGVHALALAVALGFSSTLFLAFLIKKLTKNYFMFFRFVIASAIGFSVFTFIRIYISKMNELGQISMIMESVTPSLQFITLTLMSIVPLYLLRLILGLFRGRGINSTDAVLVPIKGNLFKASTLPATQPAPSNEEEITNEAH